MEILNLVILIFFILFILLRFRVEMVICLYLLLATKFIMLGNFFPLLLIPVVVFLGLLRTKIEYEQEIKIAIRFPFLFIMMSLTLLILSIGTWKYIFVSDINITEKELYSFLTMTLVMVTCGGILRRYDRNNSSTRL